MHGSGPEPEPEPEPPQMYTPQMYTFGSGPIFWQGRASVLAVVLPAFGDFHLTYISSSNPKPS